MAIRWEMSDLWRPISSHAKTLIIINIIRKTRAYCLLAHLWNDSCEALCSTGCWSALVIGGGCTGKYRTTWKGANSQDCQALFLPQPCTSASAFCRPSTVSNSHLVLLGSFRSWMYLCVNGETLSKVWLALDVTGLLLCGWQTIREAWHQLLL